MTEEPGTIGMITTKRLNGEGAEAALLQDATFVVTYATSARVGVGYADMSGIGSHQKERATTRAVEEAAAMEEAAAGISSNISSSILKGLEADAQDSETELTISSFLTLMPGLQQVSAQM